VDHRAVARGYLTLGAQKGAGLKPQESSDRLFRKAHDIHVRSEARLALLDQQAQLATKPPRIMTAALMLPLAMVDTEIATDAPIRVRETKAVERCGIELALAVERTLGREPHEQAFDNPGYDILSLPRNGGDSIRTEVKARIEGAEDIYATHDETLTGKKGTARYRLAPGNHQPGRPRTVHPARRACFSRARIRPPSYRSRSNGWCSPACRPGSRRPGAG
jgi:hypothetical protein